MKFRLALIIPLFLLIVFSSCSSYSTIVEGLDDLDPHLSSAQITNHNFLEQEFLTNYPYKSGNFYYCKEQKLFSYDVEKSFVWLSYDQAKVYLDAKESRFNSRRDLLEYTLDGSEVFGFTFYLFEDFHSSNDEKSHFPEWFTAFGFNDGTQTMVFLGFLCYGEDDQPYCANVDFSAFLMHYYGEWFDWETGVGRSSSTENPN